MISDDPMIDEWVKLLREAIRSEQPDRPSVMILATLSRNGSPRARAVVCRAIDEDGTIWCVSDSRSKKNSQIQSDRRVEAVFWLPNLRRQFRVRGEARVIGVSDRALTGTLEGALGFDARHVQLADTWASLACRTTTHSRQPVRPNPHRPILFRRSQSTPAWWTNSILRAIPIVAGAGGARPAGNPSRSTRDGGDRLNCAAQLRRFSPFGHFRTFSDMRAPTRENSEKNSGRMGCRLDCQRAVRGVCFAHRFEHGVLKHTLQLPGALRFKTPSRAARKMPTQARPGVTWRNEFYFAF